MESTAAELARWAASGAMALTGPANGPPSAVPAAIATVAGAAADDLARATASWGLRVEIDGPAVLGERAAIAGLTRHGSTSVGGAARFVAAADGWFVLNLPRPEDVAALPALIGQAVGPDDWSTIESALHLMAADTIVEQATLLGLAVGVPGDGPPPAAPGRELSVGAPRRVSGDPLVIDLTSLWAGPLAAGLLADAGARVIKVEGHARPDGARRGSVGFFDLLNHRKECLSLDFRHGADIALLRRMIAAADLVIEGSRPRVMDELGISPAAVAAHGTSWLSITAHGRTGPDANRVGFGDDAAATGGLLVPGHPPMFVADAVADPLSGIIAAVHGADLLASGQAAVVEVPLARVARWAARPLGDAPVAAPDGEGWAFEVAGEKIEVAAPHHRPIPAGAAPHGSHSAALRDEFSADQGTSPG